MSELDYLSVCEIAERAIEELCVPESIAELLLPATRNFTPEMRLAAAVLESAIAERDERWLFAGGDDTGWPFSFRAIASYLGRNDSKFLEQCLAEMRKPGRHIMMVQRTSHGKTAGYRP